jgi:hypothetical protein
LAAPTHKEGADVHDARGLKRHDGADPADVVILRVVHRPQAADIAADLKTAHDDVEAKSSAAVSARRQRMLTTAEIRYLDEELDAAVSR